MDYPQTATDTPMRQSQGCHTSAKTAATPSSRPDGKVLILQKQFQAILSRFVLTQSTAEKLEKEIEEAKQQWLG